MKRLIAVSVVWMVCWGGYGQSRAIVDYRADDAVAIPVGDSTATLLVGNVVFHHNGAILSCDSAIRYNANYIECIHNVIINKDSTYIYGNRADFDGITNIARVYAPIVKTVDGDMTMYSYDMEFNTLTKIGRFTRGATITQKDNLMESVEGIYHVNERDIFFVRDVVMRNEEYVIRTDSMGYNFDTEYTTFYKPAQIWNKDGDFLSADRGSYDRANDTYTFTRNSYILRKDQEVFADSLTYMKLAGMSCMFGNIQLHDREQRAYLFGDYGVYWTEQQQGFMTENASGIGYDEGENPDSVYVRADSLLLHTFSSEELFTEEVAGRLKRPGRGQLESVRLGLYETVSILRPDSLVPDSLSNWAHLYGEGVDSMRREMGIRGGMPPDSLLDGMPLPPPDSLRGLEQAVDSLAAGSGPEPQLPPDETTDSLRMPPDVPDDALVPPVDSLPGAPPPPVRTDREPDDPAIALPDAPEETPHLVADSVASDVPVVVASLSKREIRRQERMDRRRQKMVEYAREQGVLPAADAAVVEVPDSVPLVDSMAMMPVDTLPKDSLQRVLQGFRNVKIYRHDMQAVCDSLVAFSLDSMAQMHIGPVLWNESNQVTAQTIHIFSRDEQLHRAEFVGEPIMAQAVLDSLFNQITGDRIETFFEANELRRMEVLNNARSYYYMQEEERPDQIGGFLALKSQDITFQFDSTKISYIIPKVDPEYSMFPMDKIPDDQPQYFPNFKWLPDLRPGSPAEVCDRPIRPTQRETSEAIPYPEFRLTALIEEYKKRLTNEGRWRDRNDKIWLDPSYFRNMIR